MSMDINKVDLTNQNQKIFAGILIVATLFLLYFLLPPLIVILTNIWIAAILAIPIVFIVMNPMLVWNIFKQISWDLTKKLISGDKLGYMYRYHEYLLGKIDALNSSITNITTMKTKITRRVQELISTIETDKKQASLYQQKEAPETIIRSMANKININTKQLDNLQPKLENVQKQEKYLVDLYNHWVADAQDLKYTLDAKAQEYKLLKELSEATGNAAEFLKGNSEEYKLYQESLDQIEQSVSQYTANVEDFERKAKPILDNLSMERSVSEDAGLALIEDFKKHSISLKMEK